MEPLSLKTQDGKIWIEQARTGDHGGLIVIDVSQAQVLKEWIGEAEIAVNASTESRRSGQPGTSRQQRDAPLTIA